MKNVKEARRERRGSSMVAVAGIVVVMASMLVASVAVGNARVREQTGHHEDLRSLYVAEAGLTDAVERLQQGLNGTIQSTNYGGGSYSVAANDIGGGEFALIATGVDGSERTRIELVVETVSTPLFAYGAFGDTGLTLDSNAFVDSYDSSDGAYSAQNGNGSSAHDHANGTVGSNASITLAQNSSVFGDAIPGPYDTVSILGNAFVTGTTMSSANLVGLDPITIPTIASSGPLTVSNSTTTSLPSGSHHFENTVVGKQALLRLEGPGTFVFNSFFMNSGSGLEVDATNGPVEIYVLDDFVLNSNTRIASTTENPSDVRFNLLSDNIIDPDLMVDVDLVDFDSNSSLYGTIYAPNAAIEINSNFELFGALIASSIYLDSNARVHFDEALLTSGPMKNEPQLKAKAWRLLAD